jgi:nitroreductase
MDTLKTIRERRSARAFRPVPIPKETVEEILKLTINAPSANNLQPWEFVVVMDEEKERLSRRLLRGGKTPAQSDKAERGKHPGVNETLCRANRQFRGQLYQRGEL